MRKLRSKIVRELVEAACRCASWSEDAAAVGRLTTTLEAQAIDVTASGARLEAWVTSELDIRVRISAARWDPVVENRLREALRSSPFLLARLLLRDWSRLTDGDERANDAAPADAGRLR